MLQNNSELVIVLEGLNDSLINRQIFFAFALTSYLFTVFVNLTLILTICLERSLHEPIYFFLCNLCFNGICGASIFYPKLLHDLLADAHVITYAGCLSQIFAVYGYVFCEFTSLTVMAYDRYLAICRPLQYRTVMTPQRVMQLVLVTWIFSLLETAGGTLLTARLALCKHHLPKIFCTNWEVVKMSCSDTTPNSIYGFVLMFSHLTQFGLILVSYTHLVRASLRLRSDRRKFVQTCLPHLITLFVFTLSLMFDTLHSRYALSSKTPQIVLNVLAAEFLVVPPLINPIIYGINLHQIRTRIVQNFSLIRDIQKTHPAKAAQLNSNINNI
ncbi:Olfactory receptor 1468 [Larimichthys crocea]|uniref:Olfactory receptor 1468 n=1 Tax=Larimichthys crocea TaxID=215358 RepID=A0A0F8AHW4_LARCR|nr:olfactory receptor 1 [Larimichthys crocea]KAE8294779.1 Olfactory receptor 1468 [Larimichthys crocea]KAE8294800.1 Olfactory receptor 1468 [Larimichthys crocea]